MTASNPPGTLGTTADGRGGASWRWAHSRASSPSRAKGTVPHSAKKRTQPSAYTSARASTRSPRICSGAT